MIRVGPSHSTRSTPASSEAANKKSLLALFAIALLTTTAQGQKTPYIKTQPFATKEKELTQIYLKTPGRTRGDICHDTQYWAVQKIEEIKGSPVTPQELKDRIAQREREYSEKRCCLNDNPKLFEPCREIGDKNMQDISNYACKTKGQMARCDFLDTVVRAQILFDCKPVHQRCLYRGKGQRDCYHRFK